jgi:signal peptidase II
MRSPLPFTLLILFGIATDLLSKWLVFAHLQANDTEGVLLIPGILHITLAQNRGVAFSLFKDSQLFILSVSALAIGGIVYMYVKNWRTARAPLIFALGLLLTGAIGNLVDRLYFGYVRDFIDFVPPVPFVGRWAIFNVADICITTGVLLFLFSEFFLQRPVLQPEATSAPAADSNQL